MQSTMSRVRYTSLFMTLMFALSLLLGFARPQAALCQTTTTHHKKNFAQRHPTMTSAAAGYAAYKIAKKTGRNRMTAGRKRNFAQRHPFLTGMAAAGATHHVIKKSIKKQQGH